MEASPWERSKISTVSDALALLHSHQEGDWVLRLARQTLVAVCNGRLFGAVTPDPLLIADALTALHGDGCVTLELLEATLDRFNQSGSTVSLSSGFDPGPESGGRVDLASPGAL